VARAKQLRYPSPPLADESVALRPWVGADADQLLAGFGDELVQEHSWPLERPYTAEDAGAFIAGTAEPLERELSLALVDPDAPATIFGGAALYELDLVRGRAGVGFWLAPAARGRGIASHATRLLAGWAFDELKLGRIKLTCGPDNLASQRVAARCGFQLEGTLRGHLSFKGGRRDSAIYGLRRDQLVR
jgi:RimJ/RimL family protein N-acetyltransferase